MGGIAARVLGLPRPTYDVDVTVALDRARLPNLYSAIEVMGCTVPEPYLKGWVDQVAGMPLVKFKTYLVGGSVDIDIFLAESPFQRSLLERRQRHVVEEIQAWFVTPEDLVLLKLIAGRPRDLVDIQDILFMQGALDIAYMEKWADELGVREALKRSLQEGVSEPS
jgi:hypothetical protein